MERRLAAIVSADIVGFGRLVDLDEAGTHARVMAFLDELGALAARYGGRIVKTTGDGALVTFDSVVGAVEYSIAAQQDVAKRSEDGPADRRLKLRIGVNLGEIILEGGDIFGQGVNIAVRLQQIAQSGAVYVSRSAVEQARGKASVHFEPVGKVALKNIVEPVDVFRAVPGAPGQPAVPSGQAWWRSRKIQLAAAAIAVVGLAAAGVLWQQGAEGTRRAASIASVAPSVPRADSIAVLPFANLGGGDDSALIVDGIFDDLITDLSKLSELTVLAANAVNAYRGQKVAPLTVAGDLDVRYVLEGSIRRIKDDLRINVRLIDSRQGMNAWAQSYSGPVTEIFDFQNNMVENIVSSLAIRVSEPERVKLLARETGSVPAYEAFQRGQAALVLKTPENLPVALAAFQKAIEIDPGYSRAYAGIGQVYWNAWVWGWESSINESEDTAPGIAKEYLERALEKPTSTAYQLASDINLYQRKFDDALDFARLAVEFAPNDPGSHMVMAEALIYGGRAGEAVPWIEAANRLDRDASKQPPPYNVWVEGMALFGTGKYSDAAAHFESALARNPEDFGPAAPLAAAYWHLAEASGGDSQRQAEFRQKAIAALVIYFAGSPDPSIAELKVYWPFRNDDDADRLIAPLRALGMPEGSAK